MDSSSKFDIKMQLDKILSNFKVNDVLYCGITDNYYIIKETKRLCEIKAVIINSHMIYIDKISIDIFRYLKKVDFIPNNIIDKFKKYGIHIDN